MSGMRASSSACAGMWRISDDDTAREYSGATRASITATAPARTSATALRERGGKLVDAAHGSVAVGALTARELREIHRRIAHAQADPAVLDGPAAQRAPCAPGAARR